MLLLALVSTGLAGTVDVGDDAPGEVAGPLQDARPPISPTITNPGIIVRASSGSVVHLDPALVWDRASGEVLDQVYERLLYFDRTSLTQFRPVLATNIPTKADGMISADGREYRFHIRPGVTFHNGNPLTPEDVEYSIERHLISDFGFAPSPMYLLEIVMLGTGEAQFDPSNPVHRQRVQDFVRVEGTDVVFNLTAPFAPFLSILAGWGVAIIDEETTIANGGWPQLYDQTILETYHNNLAYAMDTWAIGTGPYVLGTGTPGTEVILLKNPTYWNAAENPNAVDEVRILEVADPALRLSMMENGTADFADVLPADRARLRTLQQQGLVTIAEGLPVPVTHYAGMNFAIAPTSPYGGVLKSAGS